MIASNHFFRKQVILKFDTFDTVHLAYLTLFNNFTFYLILFNRYTHKPHCLSEMNKILKVVFFYLKI